MACSPSSETLGQIVGRAGIWGERKTTAEGERSGGTGAKDVEINVGRCKALSTAKDFYHLWDEGNAGGEFTLSDNSPQTTDGRTATDQIIYFKTANSTSVHDLNRHQLIGSAFSRQHRCRRTAQVEVVQQSGDFPALASASPQVNTTC